MKKGDKLCARYEFLTTVTLKITGFWDVNVCSLIEMCIRSKQDSASTFKVEK
jgi:hypothetical protein